MNQVVIIGRLTRDPELRYIPGSGTAVATFSIAVDRDYTKKDGSKETDFIPVEVIGKSAEFCANYIPKGRLVAIQGSIRVDKYRTQSGEDRTFTKINCRNIESLESSKKDNSSQGSFEPSFQEVDPDDLPF